MWVIGVLSIVTVVDRIYYTYLELNRPAAAASARAPAGCFVRAFYWTDERATVRLRPVGDRDPRVRLADAARLARRPDGRAAGGFIQWLLESASSSLEPLLVPKLGR